MATITLLLQRARDGETVAREELFAVAYDNLRRLAQARLRDGGRNTLLDTVSLVHESYLRFIDSGQLRAEDRRAFFAYASRVMRSVIVDSARERLAQRRGGDVEHLTLTGEVAGGLAADEEAILRVHEALTALADTEPRLAVVVEMRYFGGYTEREIAEALDVTERTVRRDWDKARALLESLLLDRPPQLAAARTASLAAGARVGPWQLVRELGAGGMAEVWLARRADGAYTREVALKLPRLARMHRGLGDLERRFARERDILASLEHPHIARLYDAGVGTEGLPYLAMELVPGRPLTDWCDAHRVGLRERIELFLQVIEAVQFAHARQVVHRDLKPSNILVADSGQVRLLDFGVAKLLAEDDDDRAAVHSYARALTPDYASPELLRGEPVDAAGDVYSLGAVLYELLTGERPYRLDAGAPMAHLHRAIDSVRIDKPSERLAPGAGELRATTQDRLAGRLRGSLDAIALKALARRASERYANVAAVAADLRRYLEGEPVEAAPDRLTTAELVAHLARNPKVRVRAPGSGVAAARTAQAASAPARPRAERGAVQATLRFTAQVVVPGAAAPVWSQTYEVDLAGAAGAHEAIAATLAAAVRSALDES
jgi:RNA polymerase sigma factor (TIGR02999 family)